MSNRPFRFLIDEDTAHVIRDGFLRRQPDAEVLVIGGEGAPKIGTNDEEILEFLERETYILVSSNRRTMPEHLHAHLQKGRHIPGILLLRPRSSYRQIIDVLELIWLAGIPTDFHDRLTHIPF
ncbi:MAG: DUF5615 family PIN-like protein [Candidatus Poribacteria bacterium]|nr:DUF5615 family PIN-like protein [Candidatus Poribacteria bacterium]